LPSWLLRLTWPLIITQSDRLAWSSGLAFEPLGTNAVGAIPELTALMRNTNAPETAVRAIDALRWIGTNSLPALLSAAEDRRLPFRAAAVNVLIKYLPWDAGLIEPVGPVLLRCLSDTNDPSTMVEAAHGLGMRSYAPEVSVPALLACLATAAAGSNSFLRRVTVNSLEMYGDTAAAALPALTNALSDPDPNVRSAARSAIHQITSGVLTNAPAQ
jgi:HEAT repeat protein